MLDVPPRGEPAAAAQHDRVGGSHRGQCRLGGAAYRALRARYFGSDAYDFSESALNIAAFRTGRAGKPDDGLALLRVNEEMFPGSSGMYVFRGNILLMKGDTTGAATAFREAVRRDTANAEARGRLRDIGRPLQ